MANIVIQGEKERQERLKKGKQNSQREQGEKLKYYNDVRGKKEMLPVFKELLARFLGHRQLLQSPTGLRLHRRGRHAPDD